MNCPVCLSPSTSPALTGSDVLFETTTREFKLSSCGGCGCLFLDPLPPRDEIAGYYPPQYWWNASRPSLLKKLESLYRRLALHDHISFITAAAARFGSRRVRLLDVGCGSGTLIGLLKQRIEVLGVDTSREASQVAAAESGA
jgi:SAM-dependent methyltransferase